MKTEFLALLRALCRHEIEFVVVGGVAAVIEGAVVNTVDLDIVYAPGSANLERLVAVAAELEATYRDPANRLIHPTVERLRENRMNLLRTRVGDLDAMQEVAPAWGFADAAARSKQVFVAELSVRVLDLAAVIESKSAAGRPKDLAILPVLRATLEMREQRRAQRPRDDAAD